MKVLSLALLAVLAMTSVQTQAGGLNRDGILKSNGDATLSLLTSAGSLNCYVLVGKADKLPAGVGLDSLTINGVALKIQAGDVTTNSSNHNQDMGGFDVSGQSFKISSKGITTVNFCADISAVQSQVPNTIALSIGGKTGSIQAPKLSL